MIAALFLAGAAAAAPILEVEVRDAGTVVVKGAGFPEDASVIVSADLDEPHASVACHSDFTRIALVKADRFEVTINPTHECSFACVGGERTRYVVSAKPMGGGAAAEATFGCVAPRVAGMLDCERGEAVALRQAPRGANRIGTNELRVRWRGGTRVFHDTGQEHGSWDGVSYEYCGFDPASGQHLILKQDHDVWLGVLLDERTGHVLPAGHDVRFAPDGKSYLAVVQPNGLDGEEWRLYTSQGSLLWKGYSGITAPDPRTKAEMVVASFDNPRWSAAGELEADAKCVNGGDDRVVVTLRGSKQARAWQPRPRCVVGQGTR